MDESIDWTPKARAVLEAASRLFYERGIHAVGVDAVAAAAGVTKKTLYDRFGSKDRLVAAYLADRDRRWDAFLTERLASAGPAPRARVAAFFTAAQDWADEEGGRGCAMVNAHAELSDPDHPAYAVVVGQKRRMFALLTDLAAAAGADDPGAVGELLMLLHEGAVTAAGMRTVPRPFARAATAAAELLP
ncbi:transcriptional regulator, TetR family [Georgenia satyanarayanai]|uniref:Transcriptional regulator, TetR family n=1 Tax=Georgenia satyanarayanai TaxID=860221 RepID=A0A2Y9ASP1_9MICO|nr:TetR/AcrR family transcriptional regulator [Georgenia satyanarayanai]PYF96259.1 TetR family transcriptional regulator [Georgenia satyanarayanai]SSA47095.1 transcriptional regulator, TetR family [Georgenia satyanarayanai]